MREILFRGKTLGGDWIEGSLVHRTSFYGDPCDDYLILHDGEFDCDYYEADRVENETVGQFTGLTDKNGKKIFEGDIVRCTRYRCDNMGMVGHIVYDEGCFCAKEHKSCNAPAMDLLSDYEVIGNIHDNPEPPEEG